jgi:ABC-type lipoprotein release transport system permease subunit
MKLRRYIRLSLQRKPVQSLVLVMSLTLTLLFGLLLAKFLLISNERFKTLAHEGQALIAPKSGDIDSVLSALNLEREITSRTTGYIPFNLYQTLQGKQAYAQVDQVIPFLYYGLINKKYHVLGTNQDFINRFNPDDSIKLIQGRWFNNNEEIVLGKNIANKLMLKLNDSISINFENSSLTKNFKIVGVTDARGLAWDDGAYTSIMAGQNALSETGNFSNSVWKSNVLTHILVYVSAANEQSLKSLINDRTISQFIPINETIDKLEKLTMSGASITSLLVVLVASLGLCAIFGIIISRADNTLNSFAILHSLGYSKSDIFKIILCENLILCSFASFLALGFYSLAFWWIQNNIVYFSNSNFNFWSNEFAYIILSLNFGVGLFSIIPIWVLKKRGIHNILRMQ